MPKSFFRPPGHLIKEWPEVFEDLYMNTMPVAYLEMVHLEFSNGRIWQINVADHRESLDHDGIADRLLEIFNEYQDEITKIDFKIDVIRLKSDIKKSTNKLL